MASARWFMQFLRRLWTGALLGAVLQVVLGSVAAAQSRPPADLLDVTLRVSEKGSDLVVPKAEVKAGTSTLFSNQQGMVQLSIPKAGNGVVTVTRPGFEKAEIDFDELRATPAFEVRLLPGTPDDSVVVVRGTHKKTVSGKSVSIEEAAKVAPGGDAAQVVKLLPGVQSTGRGADVVVRGSGPHDSKYYIDDLEVPFIFHNFGNLSVIPGLFLQSVDFEAGGFGPEYGDATGGIITLRTKNDIPEHPHTEFTLNLPFYSGILHSRPLSADESLIVGIRRSYIDFFLKQFLARRNANGGTRGSTTLAPYFSDAEAIYLKKRDSGHTKVSLISAYDGLKAAFPSNAAQNENGEANINIYTAFANLGVEQETRLSRDWKYKTTPQIYYYRNTADIATSTDDYTVMKLRIPTEFTRRLGKDEELYVGADPAVAVASNDVYAVQFRRDDPTFDPEDAPLVKTVETVHYSTLGTWVAIDQAFGSLVVTPGARSFYNSQIKKVANDPRLRARLALNDQNTLKAAVGQYSESPTPLQASASRGNPDLAFIKAMHYVLGLETRWNETWTSEFQLYYKTARDLIDSDPATNYNNNGSLRSRGAEVFIRRNMTGRLFGWLSYTYSKTEERKDDAEAFHNAQYDQTHVLTLVGDYKLSGTYDLGGRYMYHTGNTFTTVSDAVFDADLDKYDKRPSEADTSAGRMPASNAITAYLTHDILYDTWKLSLRGGLESYWPRPQVSNVRYNYDYSKTVAITTLTSIPFFELKGEF